ncbi:MAG: hypothetical protein K2N87_17085 [Eubacterium sp.]|nr:hypothetical protein [Eubacterium sp.]
MIISSSAVKMNSQRTYHEMSIWGGSARFVGQLSHTASVSLKNKVNKDPDREKQSNLSSSKDDLMARYSQGRSIRNFSMGSSRGLQSLQLHQVRRQSIGYVLRQMFWAGRNQALDPVSALLGDYSMGGSFLSFSRQNYFESEQTSFATEGKVVTASGKEISFNVEVEMSRSFYEETSTFLDMSSVRLTDPLVINLSTEAASVSDQKFYFDLDADGHQEQISRLNAGSGFLALDKNGDGIINDGSELFGTKSGNGFADLAQYDQDGNGWIDEADEIFDKLLIWQKDENGNDILRGLGAAGVGAIYLGNVNTEFSLNSQADNKTNAVVRQTGMYLYEDGTAGTMQQIDLAR